MPLACSKLFYSLSSLYCAFTCIYQTQESSSCHLYRRMKFSLPSRLMEESHDEGVVNFCISLFYIRFVFSCKLVDVQCSSEQHHARKQTGKGAEVSIHTYIHTQSQTRQTSLELIKFYLQCAAREENITAVSEHLGGTAILWRWWDHRNR